MRMTKENKKWRDIILVAIGVALIIISAIIMTQEDTKASTKPGESFKIQCSREEAMNFYGDNY